MYEDIEKQFYMRVFSVCALSFVIYNLISFIRTSLFKTKTENLKNYFVYCYQAEISSSN